MSEFATAKPTTVRDSATVTVSAPVDGTVRRRGRVAGLRLVTNTYHIRVRDDVWAEAQAVCLSTQRIVIESPTSVLIVNRREK